MARAPPANGVGLLTGPRCAGFGAGSLGALDDVEAERGLDDLAHFADLERKGGIPEGFDHLTALENAQIAPAFDAAGLVRALFDQSVEIRAAAELDEAV